MSGARALDRVVALAKRVYARRAGRWAIEGALLVALFAGVSAWQSRDHVRGVAPAFDLATLDGGRASTASLAGKPTLVVFWAPWCGVCQVESKNVSRVRDWVGERANVVSIASEYDDVAEVKAYVERNEVDYPVLLGGSKTARAFRVRAFPTAFILDAEGNIESSVVGYTTTAGLLARLLL